MNTRNLTCIVCPRGCQLTVSFDAEGKIAGVTGNACKRGVVYAENECTHPMRTVTSTVKCSDGGIIAVKTSDVVPKERVFDVMSAINKTLAEGGAKIGDVIIRDVCGLGVNVVATSNGI